jgi:hypothetical protein
MFDGPHRGDRIPPFVAVTVVVLVVLSLVTSVATATYTDAGHGSGSVASPLSLQSDDAVANCRLLDQQVETGETVRIDASSSEADSVEYDFDGDGTYDAEDPDVFAETHRYDQPGEYTVRVRATRNESSDIATCGTVTVEEPPTPTPTPTPTASPTPTPTATPDPGAGTATTTGPNARSVVVGGAVAGEPTTLDAGRLDGTDDVTSYSWDLDGDGNYERTGQRIEHTFTDSGSHVVGILLERDDAKPELRTVTVTVESSGLLPAVDVPIVPIVLALLVLAFLIGAGVIGLRLYRQRQKPPWM